MSIVQFHIIILKCLDQFLGLQPSSCPVQVLWGKQGFRHGVTDKSQWSKKYTKTCGIGLPLPECHDTFRGYKCLMQKTLQAVQFCRSALIQFLSRRDGHFRGRFQNSTVSPSHCQIEFFLFVTSLGDLYFIKNPKSYFQREFYPFFISIF